MKYLTKYSRVILDKVNNLPFFCYNPPKVNFLLLIAAFSFIIFGVDISSEMAVEKDEMSYVVGVLENSIEEITLTDLSVIIFNLDIEGVLTSYHVPIQTSDVLSLPRDRSPPPVL